MMRTHRAVATVSVLLLPLATVASCAQDIGGHPMANPPAAMSNAMQDVMQDAIPTSESDYLGTMVAHHTEAVAAAGQLARSDRPVMRVLGRSIVESQTAQIAQMRSWLARWYPDAPEPSYVPMMRDLSALSGSALDRAFLIDMVPHHMSAVMMSHFLLARGLADHPAVAGLATRIAQEQRREIRTMQRWLRSWFGLARHGMKGMGLGTGMGLGMGGMGVGVGDLARARR